MKKLASFDVIVLGWAALMSAFVVAFRPPGTGVYLALHALAAAVVVFLAFAHARWGGRFWTFCRTWYIVPAIMASFRELHYLIPHVHPFDDHRYDRALAAIDRRWLGDVDRFFLEGLHPAVVDVLHLCYWFYFVAMIIPAAVLYARGDGARLREYACVILTGMYVSYLGYFAVPAIGPHHFFPSRPAVLDGILLGGPMHRLLLKLELRMADAFPSGHALMSMIVIFMAARSTPGRTFWAILLPAMGCILATIALRYHYVVDVAASVAILPGVIWLGLAFHRAWEGAPPPTSSPPR